MPKYEFNVTIHVSLEVEAEDVLAAKALVENEADEHLFQTDPVMRSDTPDLDCDLVGVDGRDPNIDEMREMLGGEPPEDDENPNPYPKGLRRRRSPVALFKTH